MKNYFKKFSIMFVMSLMLVLGCSVSAFATDDIYTENLIPSMTSNTLPSGIANCDSKYNDLDRWNAWKAFDKNNINDGDQWESSNTQGVHWVSYEFPTKQKICKYTLRCLNRNEYNVYMPQEWTFLGSDDGQNWIELDKRKNEINWRIGEKREYTFDNDTEYNMYKIMVTKNNSSTYYVAIGEIEMMGKVETKSISLNQSSMDLKVKESKQLTSTTTPASLGVTWTSSDSNIATVDSTGKVTAKGVGACTITATINDGSHLSATCEVTVTEGTIDPPPVDPPTEPTGDGKLFIELVDGNIKQYDVSSDEINKFINWYNNRDNDDSESPYYKFTKGSYKDYVVHDKIDWFEVR